MKKYYLALGALLMLFSCSKENGMVIDEATFNDPNWIKLEIPDDREAHAIYGSIEDTMLVSTIYNTYQITNNGKTLKKLKKEFNQPVFGFIKSNDTLYALMANHVKDNNGFRLASYAQNYSLDQGVTWQWTDLYNNKVDIKKKFEEISIDKDVTVSLKEDIEYFPNSTTSGTILKTDLIIKRNGKSNIFKLPFNNQITSLHMDVFGKLYISATSGLHDENTKKYIGEEKGSNAIVYISKKNIKDLIGN